MNAKQLGMMALVVVVVLVALANSQAAQDALGVSV